MEYVGQDFRNPDLCSFFLIDLVFGWQRVLLLSFSVLKRIALEALDSSDELGLALLLLNR